MSKTNDTSYDAVARSERELTIGELDAVSGGAHVEWTYTPQKSDGAVDYPPTTGGGGGPAGAWNACLGVFGYGPQAA